VRHGKVDPAKPGCESITPDIYTGGKPDLGPEESKQWTAGVSSGSRRPTSARNDDWWSIRRRHHPGRWR
jgi:iron complex outermembrane receptor protein